MDAVREGLESSRSTSTYHLPINPEGVCLPSSPFTYLMLKKCCEASARCGVLIVGEKNRILYARRNTIRYVLVPNEMDKLFSPALQEGPITFEQHTAYSQWYKNRAEAASIEATKSLPP